jgi:hypothetical protein
VIVTLASKFNPGQSVSWCAPYGHETVTITKVRFDERYKEFHYSVQEYSFEIDEGELRG